MNILWFSWKDIRHPLAGGAETVSSEIMNRLVRDGHNVTLVTSRYKDSGDKAVHDGITVYYVGNRYTVYLAAKKLYKSRLKGWDDIVVDEMNTIPFWSAIYTTAKKKVLLSYQLGRTVWFYQMVFPLSIVGYLIEPFYLFITSRLYRTVVTESMSTVRDMQKFGFHKIKLFSVGMALQPINRLTKKSSRTTVLSLGAIRPMKRTVHIIKGFEVARDTDPSLQLVIAGDTSDPYAKLVIKTAQNSRHASAITIMGRVSHQERLELMRSAGAIVVTSVKEGWGLIVTEANSQGTPAVAYDVDGLRDSVQHGQTGLLTPAGNIKLLGKAIAELVNSQHYEAMRQRGWQASKHYTFEESYKSFMKAIGLRSPNKSA